jgi:formyl-CoA transferase
VGPLSGIRVIELGSMLAGPFAATLLGDFGADVVKLEQGAGDPVRSVEPLIDGISAFWLENGRNKRTVKLDLHEPKDKQQFLVLVEYSDVLIENFRAGVLESWGIGPEVLHAHNPALVIVRVTGFGQDGLRAGHRSYDRSIQAMSGFVHTTGHPDQPPTVTGYGISDYMAAVFAAFGAMLGLWARDHGAGGQVVDVASLECMVRISEASIGIFDRLGIVRQREGNGYPGAAPLNLYPCSNGDWVFIEAQTDKLFQLLCTTIGREDLIADPRFESFGRRGANRALLDVEVAAWTQRHPAAEVINLLTEAGLPVAKVNTAADVATDPGLLERGAIHHVATMAGEMLMPAVVPRLSDTPGAIRVAGRPVGDSTIEEILASLVRAADG